MQRSLAFASGHKGVLWSCVLSSLLSLGVLLPVALRVTLLRCVTEQVPAYSLRDGPPPLLYSGWRQVEFLLGPHFQLLESLQLFSILGHPALCENF